MGTCNHGSRHEVLFLGDELVKFKDILEKHNFHKVLVPKENGWLDSFGENDLLHGSPLQPFYKDGSELLRAICVTPILYKEHPKSHEVSFLVMDELNFSPIFGYLEELHKEDLNIYQGKRLFDFLRQKANKAMCLASVVELKDCISIITPIAYTHLIACTRLDYKKF